MGSKIKSRDTSVPRTKGKVVTTRFLPTSWFKFNTHVTLMNNLSGAAPTAHKRQLLSRKGVGLPRTGFASKPDNIKVLQVGPEELSHML